MEISVIGSSQDTVFCNFSRNPNAKIYNPRNSNSKGCSFVQSGSFFWSSRSTAGLSIRAVASARSDVVVSEKASEMARTTPIDGVKLYVGLPLDTVSTSNTINHRRAIAAGLKALKLLGVEGVELPVFWGIAEGEASGKYDWTGYLAVVEMVQKLDLKLHISLCFHATSEESEIPLPRWVSKIGESEPSIYFTDRSGQTYKKCLSLAVDNLPVLDGKTPLEVYGNFCENFKSAFSPFMGSTITGLSVGLGPDGELRYPSHHNLANNPGPGEFQCYDKNMLLNLKQHAEANGNPLWGLGGPHDAPRYDQSPLSGGFFAENGGSWNTTYGDFFLSWYSTQLERHGNQILALSASIFKDVPVMLSGKIPLVHSWPDLCSHPAELTAGFYNTVNRDGYENIARIFSRNSCQMILPGMDLPSQSNPESPLAQITSSCRKHSTNVSGQNLLALGGFEQIRNNISAVDSFTYQRMGAYFFSPEHFPAFTQFVRALNQPMQSLDDLPVEGEANMESLSGINLQMQMV